MNPRNQRSNSIPPIGLSLAEAAAAASVGVSSLRKLIASGDLPARRVGRRTIVIASELADFLKQAPRAGWRSPDQSRESSEDVEVLANA